MADLPIEPAAHDFEGMFAIGTFQVPRYQRAYDWKGDEVTDFARDIGAIVKARVEGKPDQHFFGALISIYSNQSKFEIVDGQQRITTLMLCLKELERRWLVLVEDSRKKRPPMSKASLERAQELNGVLFDGNDPRLSLSKRDQSYFADLMTGVATKPKRGEDQSHKRLWEAGETLSDELFEPLLTSPKLQSRQRRLQAIHDSLLKDCYVVHLNTHKSDEAYRFFMVLNDRGKPLSAGDLLRTHTLATLEGFSAQQDGAEKDWDDILRMGERLVNRFLAAYYTSYTGSRVPTGEMFDRFRTQFLAAAVKSPQSATAMREVVATLKVEAERFRCIADGEWPYESSKKSAWERDRLRRLVRSMGHRLADPLLLAVTRESSETGLRDLVRMLEPFVFRYINVVNANAGRLESLYFRHAKKTSATGKLDKNLLRKELRKMLKAYAPDDAFVALLPEQLAFSNSRPAARALIKHFLTTLEDFEDWYAEGAKNKPRVKDKTKVYDLDQVNIEHIYPQNPAKPDRLLDRLKHTLGNLTALDEGDGMKASNKEFSAKRPIYLASDYKITQPLGKLSVWDQNAIVKRVDFYTERALKIFVVN